MKILDFGNLIQSVVQKTNAMDIGNKIRQTLNSGIKSEAPLLNRSNYKYNNRK